MSFVAVITLLLLFGFGPIAGSTFIALRFGQIHWSLGLISFFVSLSLLSVLMIRTIFIAATSSCHYCKQRLPTFKKFLMSFDYRKRYVVCRNQECKEAWDQKERLRMSTKKVFENIFFWLSVAGAIIIPPIFIAIRFGQIHWSLGLISFFISLVLLMALLAFIVMIYIAATSSCHYCKKKLPTREKFSQGFDYGEWYVVCRDQGCKEIWGKDKRQREKEKREREQYRREKAQRERERAEKEWRELKERMQRKDEPASSITVNTDRRDRIPTKLRQRIWARDGGQCCNCGQAYDLHFDHIIPVSKGGSNTEENLELLCSSCNLSKSAKIQ